MATSDFPTTNVLKGVGFMCLAVALLPFLNMSAKLSLEHHSVVQVSWARYAVHFIFMVLLFAPRRGGVYRLLATQHLGIQVLRSLLLLGCTISYFVALIYVALPTAAVINFISPVLVTLLAIPMLGEQVGWRRIAAVCIGFAGAVVIIRPGSDAIHPAGLMVLLTALFYALYQILTRRIAAADSAATSATWMAASGALLLSAILPWFWSTPPTVSAWLVLLSTGFFGALGHFCVVKAFHYAPASIVSPFNYGQLIGATALGYWVWGHIPDRWTWIGTALIISSGLYIVYREGMRRRL